MGGPGPQTRGPPGRQLPPPPPPHSRGPLPPPPRPHSEPIDREKTCPLLLRVFTKRIDLGSFWGGIIFAQLTERREKDGIFSEVEFAVRGNEPKDEVQIYTRKDAKLGELTDLVKEIDPEARRRNARLSFAFVYPDKHGRFVVKQVGMTNSHGNGRQVDESKALNDLNFQIGDYLDVDGCSISTHVSSEAAFRMDRVGRSASHVLSRLGFDLILIFLEAVRI